MLKGRSKGCWKGFQRWKGLLEGCHDGAKMGFSARRVRWKGVLEGGSRAGRGVPAGFQQMVPVHKGIRARFKQGLEQALYHPHCFSFNATVDGEPQVVQRDEAVAEVLRGEGTVPVLQHLWWIHCRSCGSLARW